MAVCRFPILVFRDAAGMHTAVLVEDNGDVAGFAPTAAEAREQLRDHLEGVGKQMGWLAAPDWLDPRLAVYRVDVRPEYVADGRVYPSAETVALRVPVVTGRTAADLKLAAMPTLGIRFSYYAEADLKPLVAQYVQGRFKGAAPADVARHLPPAEAWLEDVIVHAPREREERGAPPELDEVRAVCEAVAGRGSRGRAWGRESMVEELVEVLSKEAAPVLLVGETGVGKTTLLVEAARKLERAGGERDAGGAGARARVNRFWRTSGGRIVAGMQYLGMWQERVEKLVEQLSSVSGVLCVENLLDLVRTGGRTAADSVAAFFAPYMERGELRVVAEATPAELDAARRLLPGLADLFRPVVVPPMERGAALECLGQVAAAERQRSKVEVDRGVAETVYRLFARFVPYQPLPGRAAGFVAELIDAAARSGAGRVSAADAIGLFVRRTGLPELLLRDELSLDVREVVDALSGDVIGQPEACRAAAGVITTFKAGLNDPARPLGVQLFTGPTGVGKTQLARSVARFLYGAGGEGMKTKVEDGGWKMAKEGSAPSAIFHLPSSSSSSSRLVRLDMSEYAGPGAAERFVSSAQGGPAEWIQRVRQQPFCVLLLDEIEKASPEIFDLLLGAFDEGRLTDPWGRVTHLRSAVIVMTSNLGAAVRAPFGLAGRDGGASAPLAADEAMGFFRPEFFNRIDAVVPFAPLSRASARAIVVKELADLGRREGLADRGIALGWSARVVDWLAGAGFDARYGARPLQRTLEARVVTPLAKWLIGRGPGRGERVWLDVHDGGLLSLRTEGGS